MNIGSLLRLLICVVTLGLFLYGYITQQNRVTELRMRIPTLAKQVQEIEEENIRLQFEIDQFENPIHLMELARRPCFGHLKHPLEKDIYTLSNE